MCHSKYSETEDKPEAAAQREGCQEGGGGNNQGGCCAGNHGKEPAGVERKLPYTLAGYQHVESGDILDGDIWVKCGHIECFATPSIKNGYTAQDSYMHPEYSLYRLMPCSAQGDHDDTGWKAKQDELKAKAHWAPAPESWSQKASRLVLTDRNESYGDPREDFAATAKVWSGLLAKKLKEDLTPIDIALMMTGLKLRRETNRHTDDNIIDAHGYLLTAEWILKDRKPNN